MVQTLGKNLKQNGTPSGAPDPVHPILIRIMSRRPFLGNFGINPNVAIRSDPSSILSVFLQSESLASELVQKLPSAALAGLIGTLSSAHIAQAADVPPPPPQVKLTQSSYR